jgi:hypothetical protein
MPPEPLYLRLCPDCAGEPVQVGVCRTCRGAGVLDKDDRPFEPGPPFDRWTPRQLVALDQDARRRRAAVDAGRQDDQLERLTMTNDPESGARVELAARRRLTLSDVVELLLARPASGDHSTIRLTRNARGETQIEVYVRSGEPGVETVEQARAKAEAQYDHLRTLYPMSGPTSPGGQS